METKSNEITCVHVYMRRYKSPKTIETVLAKKFYPPHQLHFIHVVCKFLCGGRFVCRLSVVLSRNGLLLHIAIARLLARRTARHQQQLRRLKALLFRVYPVLGKFRSAHQIAKCQPTHRIWKTRTHLNSTAERVEIFAVLRVETLNKLAAASFNQPCACEESRLYYHVICLWDCPTLLTHPAALEKLLANNFFCCCR